MKVTYYVASSTDGFIADASGGVGWLSTVQVEDEDYGYARFFDSVDGLIMGRRTFEDVLSFGPWPYDDRPARVLTRRALSGETDGEPKVPARLTNATPSEAVRAFDEEGLSHIWLVGGGELAAAVLEAGVLTDLVLSVVPVVLGSGIPLFAETATTHTLRLRSSRRFPSGLVQSTYDVRPHE